MWSFAAGDREVLVSGTSNSEPSGERNPHPEKTLVIVTGISGSGKASALRAFEDMGFYAVDNLPLELLLNFASLVHDSPEMVRAAIVVDVREGPALDLLPSILLQVRERLKTTVLYLDASDAVLIRRYSETRRPHPLSLAESSQAEMLTGGMLTDGTLTGGVVTGSITSERQLLDAVRNVADIIVDTSSFNVHELRASIQARFSSLASEASPCGQMLVSCLSFGFKNGVPLDVDLLFDIRFLPNPHFVAEFRKLTGLDRGVADYIRGFSQTAEFLERVSGLLDFLMPHYVQEGKSYLTIGFGCTGGQHRSVMMAEEFARRLSASGYRVKAVHRDMPR